MHECVHSSGTSNQLLSEHRPFFLPPMHSYAWSRLQPLPLIGVQRQSGSPLGCARSAARVALMVSSFRKTLPFSSSVKPSLDLPVPSSHQQYTGSHGSFLPFSFHLESQIE